MTEQQQQQPTHFSFDKSFQEKIVQALIMDRQWASQLNEVIDIDFFQFSYLKLVTSTYLSYYRKYKEFPSTELLITMLKTELKNQNDKLLLDQIKTFLKKVATNQDLGDLPHVKEKALDFCKRRRLHQALMDSVGLIESEKYDKVIDVVKTAINAGNHHSPGLDLFEDVESRYSETARKTVPTGIPELDQRKILNGGLGAGELGVCIAPTGCHAKGTEILTYNGTLEKIEDIQVGDLIMGSDSKPRRVLKLVRGKENMYKITPNKGDSFVVNENHILSLQRTNLGCKSRNPKKNGEVINISVKDYLDKSKTFKHQYKLYTKGVSFEETYQTKLPIPPYLLGTLLGGDFINKNRVELTTADEEILNEWQQFAPNAGFRISSLPKEGNKTAGYYITNGYKHNNSIVKILSELGLAGKKGGNKFIPQQYKVASRKNRLEMLAGLLDACGYLNNKCFCHITKSKQLADDIVFLSKSLGLASYSEKTSKSCQNNYSGTCYAVTIFGETSIVPTRLARKQAKPRCQIKDVSRIGFEIEALEQDDFYGFTLTGDHLYLTGDFIVHHNCGKSHFLVHVGAQALLHKRNVLHYTFELNERAMGIRYDSHIMDIPSLECFDCKEEIKTYYQENKENLGRLRIKYYPTASASAMTLRGHIDKLSTQGFVPNIILVDYAGIMRSSDRYELLRLELKKVMEELRALATELDVPIWTAIQSNKEGANSDVVDLTNMAEGYGQAHVADFVVGLLRKSANKATGFGNIFIAKNRAGIDGIKYQIHLDTAKSKLRILTDQEVSEYTSTISEDEHSFVRKKLREMQNNI